VNRYRVLVWLDHNGEQLTPDVDPIVIIVSAYSRADARETAAHILSGGVSTYGWHLEEHLEA
jgi:hypothetical protein